MFPFKKKGGGLQAALLVSVLCKVERSFLAQSEFFLIAPGYGEGKMPWCGFCRCVPHFISGFVLFFVLPDVLPRRYEISFICSCP